MAIKDGQVADADDVMNAFGLAFKNSMNAFFNSDYDGWNAKLADTGSPQVKNLLYDTLQTDSADVNSSGWYYDSTDDLYKTLDLSKGYIIIEAADATISWSSNDCSLLKLSSGQWILYYTGIGTAEVARAQLQKSLFWGTNGSDDLILDFTSVTKLATSDANDVGKKAYRGKVENGSLAGTESGKYTATVTGSGGNDSIWTVVQGNATSQHDLYVEVVTNVGTPQSSTNGGVDKMGTDMSSDEGTYTSIELRLIGAASSPTYWVGTGHTTATILTDGSVSWVKTVAGGGAVLGDITATDVDYSTTHSIPAFTAVGTEVNPSTLIFKDTTTATVTNTLSTWNASIDATSTFVASISYDGGSNYETITDATVARNTNTGTAVWLKLVNTRTDLSKIDTVMEWATAYNWY